MNKALGSSVSEKIRNGTFDGVWPKLEAALAALPQPDVALPPKRKLDDMVAEILALTRSFASARARKNQELQAQFRRYLEAQLGLDLGDQPSGRPLTDLMTDFENVLKKDLEQKKQRLGEMKAAGEHIFGKTDTEHGSEE